MKPRRRGFTLSELTVSSALVFMLTGTVLGFLSTSLNFFNKSQEQAEIHEASLLALHVINGYLQHSDIRSVQINPVNAVDKSTPNGIAFLSGFDPTGHLQYVVTNPGAGLPASTSQATTGAAAFVKDGFIIWQNYQVFYYDSANRAVRLATIPLPAPTVAPTPYRLATFTPSPTDRFVARNIDSVTFSSQDDFVDPVPSPQPTLNPVFVQVVAQKLDVQHQVANEVHTSTLETSVVMDNGFFSSGGINLNFSFFIFPKLPLLGPGL